MNVMNAVSIQAPSTTGGTLVPQNMDQAIRLAEIMARSKLVPQHLQGSVGDCFMVVEQAGRWNMSPFAVAQCTSSIKGKLMYEGKLVQAAVENSGAIVGLMDYAYRGEGQGRTITVTATRRGEAEPRTVDVILKDAITENGIWKKQPDQQLAYHGARVWARRWTPGVILGVYAPEEMTLQPHREPPHDGPTLDGVAETYQQPRQEQPQSEPSTPWIVVSRSGAVEPFPDAAAWVRQWGMRVRAVEGATKMPVAERAATLVQMLAANGPAMQALHKIGEEARVEEVVQMATAARGRLMEADAPPVALAPTDDAREPEASAAPAASPARQPDAVDSDEIPMF